MRVAHVASAIKPNANEMYMQRKWFFSNMYWIVSHKSILSVPNANLFAFSDPTHLLKTHNVIRAKGFASLSPCQQNWPVPNSKAPNPWENSSPSPWVWPVSTAHIDGHVAQSCSFPRTGRLWLGPCSLPNKASRPPACRHPLSASMSSSPGVNHHPRPPGAARVGAWSGCLLCEARFTGWKYIY